jgi:hypothetical protein
VARNGSTLGLFFVFETLYLFLGLDTFSIYLPNSIRAEAFLISQYFLVSAINPEELG